MAKHKTINRRTVLAALGTGTSALVAACTTSEEIEEGENSRDDQPDPGAEDGTPEDEPPGEIELLAEMTTTLAAHYEEIGTEFITLLERLNEQFADRDVPYTSRETQGELASVIAEQFDNAADGFESAATDLQGLLEGQVDADIPPTLRAHADAGGALGESAEAFRSGDFLVAGEHLTEFSAILSGIAGTFTSIDVAEAGEQIADLGQETAQTAAVLERGADELGATARLLALATQDDSETVALLDEMVMVLLESGFDADSLQSRANERLAAERLDGDQHGLLALSDRERAALENFGERLSTVEVQAWVEEVHADPAGWLVTTHLQVMATDLSLTGQELASLGSALGQGPLFTLGCNDLCECGDVQNCELAEMDVGSSLANPDTLDALMENLRAITQAAPARRAALAEDAVDALDALADTVLNARPIIWIKIEWELCEEERCWWTLWLATRCNWQDKEEWVKIDGVAGEYWPPIRQWDEHTLRRIANRASNKFDEENPCE